MLTDALSYDLSISKRLYNPYSEPKIVFEVSCLLK